MTTQKQDTHWWMKETQDHAEQVVENSEHELRTTFLEWGTKLRSAIRLAESRLDAETFAHSMRVATMTEGSQTAFNATLQDNTAGLKAMVVAVLHDLIEDQVRGNVVDFTHLTDEFGEEVSDAVEILTRPAAARMTYHDYIAEVAENDLATLVKIADLDDHLSEANAPTLRPTLRPRYEKARAQLKAARTTSLWADDARPLAESKSTLKRWVVQRNLNGAW